MARKFTPGDLGRLRAAQQARASSAQRREEEEQANAAGIVSPGDVACLTTLIQVLEEVSRDEPMNHKQERLAQGLVAQTRRRLKAVAAVSADDVLSQGILKEWYGFFRYDEKANRRPRLRNLLENRIPDAIELAKRARSALVAMCPEPVDDGEKATCVQRADIDRLGTLEGRLKAAAKRAVLDSDREKGIRDVASKIWGRLTEIADAEREDSAFEELLNRWRKLYQFDESNHMQVEVRGLVRRDNVALALALVQETIEFLDSRRPNRA